MKINEIILKETQLTEGNELWSLLWKLLVAYNLAKPIETATTNIRTAADAAKQGKINKEKFDRTIQHELAQCSAGIAALLVGNKVIFSLFRGITNLFGGNWFVKLIVGAAAYYGSTKFMEWVTSEPVVKVISDWLTGQAFTEYLGNSGPLYDQYIGAGLQKAIQATQSGVEKAIDKVSSSGATTDAGAKDDQASISTPQQPSIIKTLEPEAGKGFGYLDTQTTYDPTDPSKTKVNVKWK